MKKFKLSQFNRLGDDSRLFRDFVSTFKSYGCFIISESFDPHYIDSVHKALMRLFSKSQKDKLRYKVDKLKNPLAPGFSPYGISRAMDTGIPNLLETWDINNLKQHWPKDLSEEANLLLNYRDRLYELARKSLGFMSIALCIPRQSLTRLVNKKNGGIHLIHYFPLTNQFDKKARRQSKHCDNTLLSLIPPPYPISSGISLYSWTTKKWEKVIINKDECLIQTGLLLQRTTNDKIKANLHTVSNPKIGSPNNISRYSTPFFLSPGGDVTLKVLDKFTGRKKKYADAQVSSIQKEYFGNIFFRY